MQCLSPSSKFIPFTHTHSALIRRLQSRISRAANLNVVISEIRLRNLRFLQDSPPAVYLIKKCVLAVQRQNFLKGCGLFKKCYVVWCWDSTKIGKFKSKQYIFRWELVRSLGPVVSIFWWKKSNHEHIKNFAAEPGPVIADFSNLVNA